MSNKIVSEQVINEAIELSEGSESGRVRVFARSVLDLLTRNQIKCPECERPNGEHEEWCSFGRCWLPDWLKRWLWLCIIVACLTGCGIGGLPFENNKPSGKITVQPDVVYMGAKGWAFSYSPGMPPNPSVTTGATWSFMLPTKPNEVHYLVVPYGQSVIHKTMSITFKIVSTNPVYDALAETSSPCHIPPNFHLYFQAQNPNMSGTGGRWWSNPANYVLGSRDNQIVMLTVPLDSFHWSGVFGESGAAAAKAFNEAWKNVGGVGITFGAGCSFGHGIALDSGKSEFRLLDFKIQ